MMATASPDIAQAGNRLAGHCGQDHDSGDADAPLTFGRHVHVDHKGKGHEDRGESPPTRNPHSRPDMTQQDRYEKTTKTELNLVHGTTCEPCNDPIVRY